MGCGTSAPRAVQPAVVGPASAVPHHPERSPSELYKVITKKPDRIRTVSPRKEKEEKDKDSHQRETLSPTSNELPAFEAVEARQSATTNTIDLQSPDAAQIRLRSTDSDATAVEHMWDVSSASTMANRVPRHTLALLHRSVFDYLPPTVATLSIRDCEDILGRALRLYPAFMPEDAQGNIAVPPRAGTQEENAKKDMRAWIMATSFDRPATPVGHCTAEPSPIAKTLTDKYMSLRARMNDRAHTNEELQLTKPTDEKNETSSEEGPKQQADQNASPHSANLVVSSPKLGDPLSPTQLSPTRAKKSPMEVATGTSFLDRESIRISQDVLLEECEASDIGSTISPSINGSSLVSPGSPGPYDTVSHGAVSSSTNGRPSTPTKVLRSIQAMRAMRDIGMSKSKKKLAERVCAWIELTLLTVFEDEANSSSPVLQASRSISQTAAPLNAANLTTLQSQLNAMRSRAVTTTLHPSPDNDDFFMNVPSAICWFYGAEPFYPTAHEGHTRELSQILPPCVLRFPYNYIYGFAIARSADITRRAAQKLSSIVVRDNENSAIH